MSVNLQMRFSANICIIYFVYNIQRCYMEQFEVMPVRVRLTAVLKKAIYTGEIKSGQELSLTDIAAQTGVSRTPVREAFQALAAEGLITLRMNKGAIVNRIDADFIKDHYELRALLESAAAAKAAEKKPDVSGLLTRAYKLREHPGSVSRDEYEKLNQEIHLTLWNEAGNKRMKDLLMDLWNGPSTGESPEERQSHYQKSTEEHIRILEAVQKGDPASAKEAMNEHITRSMNNILRYYEEQQGTEE